MSEKGVLGEALFSLVGEKCCNTTMLDPQQLTFQPFVGATFISFVGPTVFVSQQLKTVEIGGNYVSFVVPFLLFLYRFWLRKVLEVLFSFCGTNNFSPRPTKLGSPK